MYKILSAVPPSQKQSGADLDSHPVITISHDEVIDIFAFSSARGLDFTCNILHILWYFIFYNI